MTTDPTRRAIEAILSMQDTMEMMAAERLTGFIDGIVTDICNRDAAARHVDRKHRWQMAVRAVNAAAASKLSQEKDR